MAGPSQQQDFEHLFSHGKDGIEIRFCTAAIMCLVSDIQNGQKSESEVSVVAHGILPTIPDSIGATPMLRLGLVAMRTTTASTAADFN